MDFEEYKGKTLEEALAEASTALHTDLEGFEYEVVEQGTSGFLGIGSKPFVIKARLKDDIVRDTKEYLSKIFGAMQLEVGINIDLKEEEGVMDIDLEGPEMGILIGKRGQTLDSLQYLTSLFVNKKREKYIRVKLDTENYRERRKETLENLAKNIAYKVKKTRRQFVLEPMNPYERRIIHSTLQNDKYVATKSEGEEPYRRVVVYLKKGNGYNSNYGSYRK